MAHCLVWLGDTPNASASGRTIANFRRERLAARGVIHGRIINCPGRAGTRAFEPALGQILHPCWACRSCPSQPPQPAAFAARKDLSEFESQGKIVILMSLPIALVTAGLLAAAAPSASTSAIDSLFARLAKAPTVEEAKPIEKEILLQFLQSGSASVDLLMTRADSLLEEGDRERAAKILDAVTAIAPGYAEGWHQKGKLEAEGGHDEAAMVSLQKAVNLNPREFQALVELGDMLAEYGARPAALAAYKRALALDPRLEGLERRVEELSRDVEGNKI